MATQILGKVAYTSRGAYDSSFSYEINDVVTYKGSSYVSKKETKGNLPTNEEYWMLLAEKGATYQVTKEDLNNIANEITADANSAFNQNVTSKTNAFDANATSQTSIFNENAGKKITAFNNNATSALSAYNTNHNEKVEAYNTNASAKLKEFNDNAESYDERITDNTNRTKRISNDLYDSGEASGTSINIKDSTLAEFQEITVDGVCKQVTTTGKNRFDVSKLPMTLGGVTISVDKDGNVVLNGTPTITSDYINFIVSQEIEFEPNTYTMSVENKKAGIGTAITGFEGKLNLTLNETVNSKTYTSTETYTSTLQINVRYDVGTLNNFILNPLLETGETKTKYEMFTGNQSSPSPSYPQPIEVIYEGFDVVSCAKNLCNITSVSPYSYASKLPNQPNDNIVIEKFDSNSFSYSIVGDSYYMGLTNNMYLKPNTNYKFSLFRTDNNVNNNARNYIYNVTNEGTYTLNKEYNATGELKNQFTTSETGIIALGLGVGNNSNGANGVIEKIMISEDSTEYEPYQESVAPINLPDGEFVAKINETDKDQVRIAFNEEDGEYQAKLDKNVGRDVLNGSENIFYAVEQGDYYLFQIYNYKALKEKPLISNKLIYANNWGTSNNVEAIFNTYNYNGTIIQVKILSSRLNELSIDGVKEYLSQNPIEYYYPLAEPYKIDLGVVEMPLSYSPETNVFTTSELEALINAKYYRNFINTIQNLQVNEKALKEELVDINSRLTALETNLVNLANVENVESEVVE